MDLKVSSSGPADAAAAAAATATINPEKMTDYFDGGKSSGSGTIRETFVGQFETLKGCYRTWHQILWRQAMLMIVSHMDSGSPLNRIICLTIDDSSNLVANYSNIQADVKIAGGGCEEVKSSVESVGGGLQRGIIIDILSIKQMATSVSPNTPVVFIRYAETKPGQHDLLLSNTAHDFANSCTVHCTSSEIESILLILEEESWAISSSYQKKWKKQSTYNGTSFKLSLIRPVTESSLPSEVSTQKVITRKQSTQKLRRTCSLPGCTSNAHHQCSLCKTSYYCSVAHQKKHRSDHKSHCVPPPPLEPVEVSTLTEQNTTTAPTNVSITTPSSDATFTSLVPAVTSIPDTATTASTSPEFNPYVDIWPGTVGPGSSPPSEDIWDDATPKRRSVLVDLKNVSFLFIITPAIIASTSTSTL